MKLRPLCLFSTVLAALLATPTSLDAVTNRFHLRGEGDATDASGSGNDGRIIGPGVTYVEGVVGEQAFHFDGSGSHVRLERYDIDLRSSFTLAFWLKTDDRGVNGVIFSEGVIDRLPSGRLAWISADRSIGDGRVVYEDTGAGRLASTSRVDDGSWHHVAISVDYEFIAERPLTGVAPFLEKNAFVCGRISLYVDGLLDAESPAGEGLAFFRLRQGVGPFCVGGIPPEARLPDYYPQGRAFERNQLRGALDDVQLFEGVLDAEQIATLSAGPIACPPDDTRLASVAVEALPATDYPANSFKVTAQGARDDSGDEILHTFTLNQLSGPRHRHGTPREVGPKRTRTKTWYVETGDPPVRVERRETRRGSEAVFRLWEGTYTVTAHVTDQDNLPCKDEIDGKGCEDNAAVSDEIVVSPLEEFTYKFSSFGKGRQFWYQAEDVDVADGLFALGDAGGWQVIDHPGAFGGVITRAPAATTLGALLGCGERGGRVVREFDLELAGMVGGQHYFWARVVNPSNSSDYGLVRDDPGDLDLPRFPDAAGAWPGARLPDDPGGFTNDDRIYEENGNWGFVWQKLDLVARPEKDPEGHAKVLQPGLNEHHIFHRQGCRWNEVDVHVWTDDPLYEPTDADLLAATTLHPFRRGDCNGDGGTDLSDGVRMLGFSFVGNEPPACVDACDFNASGALDITNAVFFFNALFQGGVQLPPPTGCGFAAPILGCRRATCRR